MTTMNKVICLTSADTSEEFDIDPNFMISFHEQNPNETHPELHSYDKNNPILDLFHSQKPSFAINLHSNNLYFHKDDCSYTRYQYSGKNVYASFFSPNLIVQQENFHKFTRTATLSNTNLFKNNVKAFVESFRFNLDAHKQFLASGDICFQNSFDESFTSSAYTAKNNVLFDKDISSLKDSRPYLFYSKKQVVDTVDELPVFSGFSKSFYNLFKDSCIKHDAYVSQYQPTRDFREMISCRRVPLPNFNSILKSGPKLGFIADISSYNQDLANSIDASTKKRFKVLDVQGWASSKLVNAPVTIVEYTKSQVVKRKIVLIPTLIKVQYRDEDFNLKDGYLFSMVSNTPFLFKSSASVLTLTKIINTLIPGDGFKFADPEAYRAELFSKLGKVAHYSPELFANVPEEAIDALSTRIGNQKPLPAYDNSAFAAFTAKLNINPEVDKKYNLANSKKQEVLAKIQEEKNSIVSVLNAKAMAFRNYMSYYSQLKEQREAFHKTKLSDLDNINQRFTYSKTIDNSLSQLSKDYNQELQRALAEKDYINDDFLKNIEKEDVYIEKIAITSDSGSATFFYTQMVDFLSFIKNKSYKISEIILCLTKPQKIKVDNNPNNIVVGGPYRLQLVGNNLTIAILNLPAVFGFSTANSTSYGIHPHAARVSSIDSIFDQSRCCLGEASPLIHKAATSGDLKTLIYSILIWVRSANSADPWGRNYSTFPTLSQVTFEGMSISDLDKLTSETSESIQEDDVTAFLAAQIEEPEEDNIEPEEEDDFDDEPPTEDAQVQTPPPVVVYRRYTAQTTTTETV